MHSRAPMRSAWIPLFLATACGGEPAGTTTHSFDDCDLGVPSEGRIIMYGTARNYLVEFGRGDTRVNLARMFVDGGVGESKLFANGGLALKRQGTELCVTDESKLEYENSHHNWLDAAELTEGSIRYRLELTFDLGDEGGWRYELSAFEGDSKLFGPEPLDLLSGPQWP